MLPAKYEPMHVIRFSDGSTEFIKSSNVEAFKRQILADRFVTLNDVTYAVRLIDKVEPYVSDSGIDQYLVSLPQKTRVRLLDKMKEWKGNLGKEMPLQSAQALVEQWAREASECQQKKV